MYEHGLAYPTSEDQHRYELYFVFGGLKNGQPWSSSSTKTQLQMESMCSVLCKILCEKEIQLAHLAGSNELSSFNGLNLQEILMPQIKHSA